MRNENEQLTERIQDLEDIIRNHQHKGWDLTPKIEIGRGDFKKIKIGANTIVVNPGESIQSAINELSRLDNGGIVKLAEGTHKPDYTITGKPKVSIIGAGRDVTIIDFQDLDNNIDYTSDSAISDGNFVLSDFTVQNLNTTSPAINMHDYQFFNIDNIELNNTDGSGGGAGLKITDCGTFEVDNVIALDFSSAGIHLLATGGTGDANVFADFKLSNCRSQANLQGFRFETTGGVGGDATMTIFSATNCYAVSNTSHGFFFDGSTSDLDDFTILNCQANSNGGDGFEIGLLSDSPSSFVGCSASGNTGKGFDISHATGRRIKLIGCSAISNTGNGIEVTGTLNQFVGCTSSFNAEDWKIIGEENIFIGSDFSGGVDFTDEAGMFSNNIRQTLGHIRNSIRMKNVSGSAVAKGDTVVITVSSLDGREFTTTTTAGDDFVLGMALESIGNNQEGDVLITGFTTSLKVDGTTDIAAGDYLSTFTSAGIAQKASSGDMAFAIAHEAYATDDSNGVIDALIIKPRKI